MYLFVEKNIWITSMQIHHDNQYYNLQIHEWPCSQRWSRLKYASYFQNSSTPLCSRIRLYLCLQSDPSCSWSVGAGLSVCAREAVWEGLRGRRSGGVSGDVSVFGGEGECRSCSCASVFHCGQLARVIHLLWKGSFTCWLPIGDNTGLSVQYHTGVLPVLGCQRFRFRVWDVSCSTCGEG